MPSEHVFAAPPRIQSREALLVIIQRPIELWREIIDPTLTQPASGVGERLGIRIQTGDALWMPWPPDAEWADADQYPALLRLDLAVQRAHEVVDVRATPRSTIGPAAGDTVPLPGGVVGKAQRNASRYAPATLAALYGARDRRLLEIRIEVVIDVDAIDVITVHDFKNRVEHRTARGGNSRIDPRRLSVLADPVGVSSRDVSRDRLAEVVRRHRAEGIEPHVQLQSPRMRLRDRQRQRVIADVAA